LNVVSLKNWIGRSWSKGKFTDGLNSIKTAAKHFLLTNSTKTSQDSNLSNEIREQLTTPLIRTPISANNFFFSSFQTPTKSPELDNEIIINAVEKEVDVLRAFLSAKNNDNLNSIFSTRRFWLLNIETYPKLTKLAEILLNINSSSACIERYFSICGFCSKKNRANTHADLFVMKTMLRANINILKKIQKIKLSKNYVDCVLFYI